MRCHCCAHRSSPHARDISLLIRIFIGNGIPPHIALFHIFTTFPAMQRAPHNIFSLSF
ncbi:hypothetical protein BDI4_920003 [Burkholderia diffusa]|nr:hypothetical protein BDI4_920003 [Burkholderia diffusa]